MLNEAAARRASVEDEGKHDANGVGQGDLEATAAGPEDGDPATREVTAG